MMGGVLVTRDRAMRKYILPTNSCGSLVNKKNSPRGWFDTFIVLIKGGNQLLLRRIFILSCTPPRSSDGERVANARTSLEFKGNVIQREVALKRGR